MSMSKTKKITEKQCDNIQVKSRTRVANHGEVFTAEREVKAMCDLVQDECNRIESRFLEPACGDGNFLAEILGRKLRSVKRLYRKNLNDFEQYSFLAVSSIYGVELLADNAKECRERLFLQYKKFYMEKLIKFATRVPVFMYLTDFREFCLRDVITQLEPELFKKVTGLTVKDFELLVSLNVFNGPVMNDAIFKFRCYENSSLNYTGINRHEELDKYIGGFDTAITVQEFENLK